MKKFLTAKNSDGDNVCLLVLSSVMLAASVILAVLLDALSGAFLLEVVMKKFLTAKNSDGDNVCLLVLSSVMLAASVILPFFLVEWL